MRQPEEQFHLLIDAVKDYAIFMLDTSGNITTWNPGVQRIKGYSPNEVLGKHFSMFYTPEDQAAERPRKGLERSLAEGRFADTGVRVRKDGSRFVADVVITPVYSSDGELVGFAKVTRDVTERHRLEEQLRQRVDELAEADRRKDEFIAMLAHELRNPLAPVFAGVGILERASTHSPQSKRALAAMDRQLKLMSRLVDDLLQVSRITRGKVQLRRTLVRLHEVVEQAVETVSADIEKRGQRLVVQCAPEIAIYADAQRLVQVVSNVIGNASKYSQQGGTITITADRDQSNASLTVQDNGVGIRAEMLDRIFELFTQDLRPTGTELHSGLGVGLALARSIVAMHGGRIWAFSEGPGTGATIDIRLPLLAVGDHEEDAPQVDRQFRILVVDDNKDAADMIGGLLELEGYAVRTAYAGREALRVAEDFHPHMILLDLAMPDITGYEVIKRVRNHPGGPVVVAVTGHSTSRDRAAVRDAGFDDHIVKPFDGDQILGVVRRFLAGRSFSS